MIRTRHFIALHHKIASIYIQIDNVYKINSVHFRWGFLVQYIIYSTVNDSPTWALINAVLGILLQSTATDSHPKWAWSKFSHELHNSLAAYNCYLISALFHTQRAHKMCIYVDIDPLNTYKANNGRWMRRVSQKAYHQTRIASQNLILPTKVKNVLKIII